MQATEGEGGRRRRMQATGLLGGGRLLREEGEGDEQVEHAPGRRVRQRGVRQGRRGDTDGWQRGARPWSPAVLPGLPRCARAGREDGEGLPRASRVLGMAPRSPPTRPRRHLADRLWQDSRLPPPAHRRPGRRAAAAAATSTATAASTAATTTTLDAAALAATLAAARARAALALALRLLVLQHQPLERGALPRRGGAGAPRAGGGGGVGLCARRRRGAQHGEPRPRRRGEVGPELERDVLAPAWRAA